MGFLVDQSKKFTKFSSKILYIRVKKYAYNIFYRLKNWGFWSTNPTNKEFTNFPSRILFIVISVKKDGYVFLIWDGLPYKYLAIVSGVWERWITAKVKFVRVVRSPLIWRFILRIYGSKSHLWITGKYRFQCQIFLKEFYFVFIMTCLRFLISVKYKSGCYGL